MNERMNLGQKSLRILLMSPAPILGLSWWWAKRIREIEPTEEGKNRKDTLSGAPP